MVIQAFADDSGVFDGTSTVLSLAAFVGPAEHWAEFSDEWAHYLRQTPAIRYFKMAEAAGLHGQFHRWTEEARDRKLRGLAKIIDRHPRLVCWQSSELKAAKFLDGTGVKPMANLYIGCFQRLIHDICITLWAQGVREEFEMIFDEQVIHGTRAREWYAASKIVTKAINAEAFSILPTDILFRKDEEYLPLQAADLWAWCVRYAQERSLTPETNSEHKFAWILKEFSNLGMSRGSRHMAEQNYIESWRVGQVVRSRPLPAQLEAGRREFAMAMPKRTRSKPKKTNRKR